MDKISQYEQLLSLLQAERFVSGNALAQALGISRTVVNRRLQELSDMGLRVHAVTGKGYHLADPFTLLEDPPLRFPPTLHWHRHLITASTNEDALALARLQRSPVLVATEYQTQGRGRRGRGWSSAFGQDLAFSISFPLSSPEALRPFSLAAGVRIAVTLRDHWGIPVQVKWPNDLQVDGAKLAGILTEIHTLDGQTWVIMGVGLNVNGLLHGQIGQPAISLRDLLGARQDRSHLLSALANALTEAVAQEFDFNWQAEWSALDALAGRQIRVVRGEQVLEGVASGVGADGALLLETKGGRLQLTGGQVSVRAV